MVYEAVAQWLERWIPARWFLFLKTGYALVHLAFHQPAVHKISISNFGGGGG